MHPTLFLDKVPHDFFPFVQEQSKKRGFYVET